MDVLNECMKNANSIRNICILAHVDHGKTTVADQLLALNRIVSKRLAGTVRYLDDREDEQTRGITMKSSCISLLWKSLDESSLLVNLVDTPGHIDFDTEVAAAARVCDGALIVVDVVEGVCVQTREAIKKAFHEGLKMILILNKLDKLITELRQEVLEIFQNLLRVIEDCNAYLANLIQYESAATGKEIEETEYLFSPDTGNVIFASSLHGWGFTFYQIAHLFLEKIEGEDLTSLCEKMWDFDYFVDSKTRRIKRGAIEGKKENLFQLLCLKTIHHVYSTLVTRMERDRVDQIIEKLKIKAPTRDMYHNDPRIQIKSILQAWSPLAEVIMMQVKSIVPPPSKLREERIKYLINYDTACENQVVRDYLPQLIDQMKNCLSSEDVPVLAYVSKMFCINKRRLSQNKSRVPESVLEVEEITDLQKFMTDRNLIAIALGRVFKGTLCVGQELFYSTECSNAVGNVELNKSVRKTKIRELYMLFGRELVPVDSVPAGNICGIAGLEESLLRRGTLSGMREFVPFIETQSLEPVVRNSIEPVHPNDLPELRVALRVLMLADSCLRVFMQESGELVLVTAGDVHLAKCEEDLKNITGVSFVLSEPVVSLRETVDVTETSTINATCTQAPLTVSLLVVLLPNSVARYVKENYKSLRTVEDSQQISGIDIMLKRKNVSPINELRTMTTKNFQSISVSHLRDALGRCAWKDLPNKIWSVGKMGDSVNLLINDTDDYARTIFETLDESDLRSCFDHCVVNAFDNFTSAGPVCGEPLVNCAFVIKKFRLEDENVDLTPQTSATVEFFLKNTFKEAFQKSSPRLMEPIFTTDIRVSTNILGKVYGVISKRFGRVLEAVGMDEQEKTFMVKAELPVIESIGFANEIRKTTSGQAVPSLKFDRYEVVEGDPLVEPSPLDGEDEEEEEAASRSETAMRANKLMKLIRRRKGLQVDEQVVIYAEKQRTLNKKK